MSPAHEIKDGRVVPAHKLKKARPNEKINRRFVYEKLEEIFED